MTWIIFTHAHTHVYYCLLVVVGVWYPHQGDAVSGSSSFSLPQPPNSIFSPFLFSFFYIARIVPTNVLSTLIVETLHFSHTPLFGTPLFQPTYTLQNDSTRRALHHDGEPLPSFPKPVQHSFSLLDRQCGWCAL